MKTLSVEKARENYEKAKERAETLQKKAESAAKQVQKCEAALIEAENAEYVRIVREMNISITELREIRKGKRPQTVIEEIRNEEEVQENEYEQALGKSEEDETY